MEIRKTTKTLGQQTTGNRSVKAAGSFGQVLSGALGAKSGSGKQQGKGELLEIGTVTRQTPTVSELLHRHEELKKQTWAILGHELNRSKDYRSIPPGTKIFIDRESGELSWTGSGQEHAVSSGHHRTGEQPDLSVASGSQTSKPVRIGTISSDTPTVSHLLRNDPRFRDQTWEILDRNVNADKPFHSMQYGTEVTLDSETMEISWRTGAISPEPPAQGTVVKIEADSPEEASRNTDGPVADLSEAVKPYMGRSYKEIDCYELLVNGLKRLDIPYGGRNGLYSRLTRMATDRGMAENAYLNGEGIVEAAGSTVLSRNYPKLTDWQKQSAELVSDIEPLLNSGQILSFSTRTKGHTGIVSRQDDRWTFINSGELDNPVDKGSLKKGVGEEVLVQEIRNWFKLAHKSGEHLRVTLGELNLEKVQTASSNILLPGDRI